MEALSLSHELLTQLAQLGAFPVRVFFCARQHGPAVSILYLLQM